MGCRSCTRGPRRRLLAGVLALAGAGLLAVLALSGSLVSAQEALLTLAPAFALALLMLARPYVGERTLARLRTSRRRARLRAPCADRAPRHGLERAIAGGGRLIAASLAGRAPPLALAGRG